MIAFLLENWKWLLGAAASLILALYVGIQKIEISSLKAAAAKTALAIERQKTEAAQLLADETAKVLAKERENAALNAQLEKERADAQAQHVADNANLRDAMLVWQRSHPGCRARGPGTNGADTGASGAAEAAAGGVEQLPAGSGAFIQSVAAAADTLSAYARECHAFVTTLEK